MTIVNSVLPAGDGLDYRQGTVGRRRLWRIPWGRRIPHHVPHCSVHPRRNTTVPPMITGPRRRQIAISDPFPRVESCNANKRITAQTRFEPEHPARGHRRSADDMTQGQAGRRDDAVLLLLTGGLAGCAHVDGGGTKRYPATTNSVSEQAHLNPLGPAGNCRSRTLSCREAGAALKFASGAEPGTAHPPRPRSPSTSLSLRRKPRESVHQRQLYPLWREKTEL